MLVRLYYLQLTLSLHDVIDHRTARHATRRYYNRQIYTLRLIIQTENSSQTDVASVQYQYMQSGISIGCEKELFDSGQTEQIEFGKQFFETDKPYLQQFTSQRFLY